MIRMNDIRFAIDTGGTFTDIVVLNEATGNFAIDKALTTPTDTTRGIMAAIESAKVDLTKVSRFFVHGSTTALNAMLEKKGVKTAFITTKGFRDVPEIMRYNRPEMYNPKYRKPEQIIPRDLRFEITERTNTKGEILRAIDEVELRAVAKRIQSKSVQAIAVCFLHSFKNASNEKRAKEIMQEEISDIPVAISSEVVSEHREFERGMTTILNAYLAPVVEKWVGNLQRELKARGFSGKIVLTKSDGGGMTADAAKGSPINMLLSGPAGGIIGGQYMANVTDYRNMITMDVGGTSFDVAIIKDGKASTHQQTKIGGYPVLIPNLDIRTIGAGGGSIAKIDEGGALQVGPQSAGALPGPICYGRGGTLPTVTDAFLASGYINEQNFLGGRMSLDRMSAETGIRDHIAKPLRLDLHQAAGGILRLAMANMAEAVKDIVSESGDDPRDFAMLCFGGGGPMFGAFIMEELMLPAAIIPIVPSTFSAWGMLMVDLRHDLVQTISRRLLDVSGEELLLVLKNLENNGHLLLDREHVPQDQRKIIFSADMRYAGQEHTVSVPLEFDLSAKDGKDTLYHQFEKVYNSVYGYKLGIAADVVNLRISAIGKIPTPKIRRISLGNKAPEAALIGVRRARDFLDGTWRDNQIYNRDLLKSGNVVVGPAMIEEATTVTIVRPGQTCLVDCIGNLVITRQ